MKELTKDTAVYLNSDMFREFCVPYDNRLYDAFGKGFFSKETNVLKLQKGKILGIEVIVVHTGNWEKIIEKILPLVENYRIKVAIENIFNECHGAKAKDLKK